MRWGCKTIGTVLSCTAAWSGSPASGAGEAVMSLVGRLETGVFDSGAAEIPAYHAASRMLLVTGGDTIWRIDLSDPEAPGLLGAIAVPDGMTATSVAGHGDLFAVAFTGPAGTAGTVAFLDPAGNTLATVLVGPNPDMLTFTPDGRRVLVANEGEPSEDYGIDPEGSVSVIDLSGGLASATVRTVRFGAISVPEDVRTFGPGASAAQDLEPEYIAVSGDGTRAWVTLQENNALALFDVNRSELEAVVPLGYKDHRLHGLDASNRDDSIQIRPWPVWGMYQPDAVVAFDAGGVTYLATANEGDARDYVGYSEETRVGKVVLDPVAFPDAQALQAEHALGRLKITSAMGDVDGDGDYDALYAYGARSIAILDGDGRMLWESGDLLERIVAAEHPTAFNADNDESDSRDSRSDDKGPEPEGLAVGRMGDAILLFVGLERTSGIVVLDVTVPRSPRYLGYAHNRPAANSPAEEGSGDLGPEGLLFVEAADSPNGVPLLIVANEVSGTISIYAGTSLTLGPSTAHSDGGIARAKTHWREARDAAVGAHRLGAGLGKFGAAAGEHRCAGG